LVNLNPNHISIYSLIWEEGTKFFRDLKSGKLKETDNNLEANMYEYIGHNLENKDETKTKGASLSLSPSSTPVSGVGINYANRDLESVTK
ncbi:hypothetical protein ACW0S0_00190, partial [Fusobacterium polymorphum]